MNTPRRTARDRKRCARLATNAGRTRARDARRSRATSRGRPAAATVEGLVEVDRREADRRIDHLRRAVPGAVDSRTASRRRPRAMREPRAAPAAHVEHRARLHELPQMGDVQARGGEQVRDLLVVPAVVVESAERVVRAWRCSRANRAWAARGRRHKCTRGARGGGGRPATGSRRTAWREGPALPGAWPSTARRRPARPAKRRKA